VASGSSTSVFAVPEFGRELQQAKQAGRPDASKQEAQRARAAAEDAVWQMLPCTGQPYIVAGWRPPLKFEWDQRKDASNRAKHGVAFEAAKEVFADANALTDLDYSEPTEERWRIIGRAQDGVLFVVFTERDDDVIRVISARRANRHEQDRYYREAFPER
jgi:uncharacterized protein